MKKYFLLMFLLLLPLNVAAKDNLILNCDQYTFKEFENFTCRTSVNTSFEFDKISFEVDLSKGISLNEVRSNYTGLWKLSINKNIIIAETRNSAIVSGLQEFGILLLSTMEYGNQQINLNNITLINSSENKTLNIEETNKEIKILSSENKLKNIYIDGTKIERFNSEIYVYKINIEKNQNIVNITADSTDENSKITGIGEIEIESNNKITVAPIIAKSESGVNRIYYVYLIKEDIKEDNIKVSSIELKDNKKNLIDFKFNPEVYEYNLEVDPKISSISLNIKLDDENLSLVKNFGNRMVDIQDGDNALLIKIKNNHGEVKTYVLNITKLLSNKSANFYLKSLSVDKYNLKFNKKVKVYNLAIKKSTKKLDISAVAEDRKSIVNIIGNENLKTGSIIKIIVKAENESKFVYQINISNQKNNILIPIIYLVLFFSLVSIIYKGVKKYKKQKDMKKVVVKKDIVKKTVTSNKTITQASSKNVKKESSKKTNNVQKQNNKNKTKDIQTNSKKNTTKKKTVNKNKKKTVKSKSPKKS